MRAEFVRSDARGWKAGTASVTVLLLLLAVDARTERVSLMPPEFSRDTFPAAAVGRAQEAGLDGRLLSEYGWGGYILYSWPGQRLFVDSMADFFGDDLIREYLRMRLARPGWRETLAHRDISLVLFAPDAPLVRELKQAADWRVAHEDQVSVLFVRVQREDAAAAPERPARES